MAEATARVPSASGRENDGLHTARADGLSSQHADAASGEESSCSAEQQSAEAEVGPPWAKAPQQPGSSAELGPATAMPARHVSTDVTQHAQHPTGHESPPAQVSPAASAATSTSCTAASAAGDKPAGSGMSAAVDATSKQLLTLAAPKPAAAATAGVPARPGAGRESGGNVERRPSCVPAMRPAQTAAEMLSWLDATLSAKKPSTGKAAGSAAAKVQHCSVLAIHTVVRMHSLCMLSHKLQKLPVILIVATHIPRTTLQQRLQLIQNLPPCVSVSCVPCLKTHKLHNFSIGNVHDVVLLVKAVGKLSMCMKQVGLQGIAGWQWHWSCTKFMLTYQIECDHPLPAILTPSRQL